MKKVILTMALFMGFNASAGTGDVGSAEGPRFSAFVANNVLYATILGDTCNHYIAELKVSPMCLAGRLTKNYAEVCEATLQVGGTELYCGTDTKPRVLQIDLKNAEITSEAKVLELEYLGRTIEVQLEK
ncbi:hypothetical protein [Bdellovibrio sp. HCB337]|uniref:hypothetical protein n=1 Tax=Bdellovibrio sp. HCB337 TaxID=3394358 RepID=UPI0039A764EC